MGFGPWCLAGEAVPVEDGVVPVEDGVVGWVECCVMSGLAGEAVRVETQVSAQIGLLEGLECCRGRLWSVKRVVIG